MDYQGTTIMEVIRGVEIPDTLRFCYRYERFVGALEEATKDTLSFLKEKALKVSACEGI